MTPTSIPASNVFTTTLAPIKLPTTPGFYYLGVKIDPNSQIHQTYAPNPSLSTLVTVGPRPACSSRRRTSSGQERRRILPVFPAKPSTIINPVTTTVGKPVLVPDHQPVTTCRCSRRPRSAKVSAKAVKGHPRKK